MPCLLPSRQTRRLGGRAALRVDLAWLSTRVDDDASGGPRAGQRHRARTTRLAFDRRTTLRLIARHDRVDAEPLFTDQDSTRDGNVHILFRYFADPRTALDVGFNINETNLDLLADGDRRHLERTDRLSPRDASKVFVRLSYLVRL